MRTPRRLNPGLNFEACGGADGKKSRKIILRAAIRNCMKYARSLHFAALFQYAHREINLRVL